MFICQAPPLPLPSLGFSELDIHLRLEYTYITSSLNPPLIVAVLLVKRGWDTRKDILLF